MASFPEKSSLLANSVINEAQPPISPQMSRKDYNAYELDDLCVSFFKRLYAQLNILAMYGNTLSAIFYITAAISLIPEDDTYQYQFCEYGNPLYVNVQCPYLPSPVFICFLLIWTIYFATMLIYKTYRTYPYRSNDLRFYLACDMVNNEYAMYTIVGIGFLLTFISAITGLAFVTQNGSTNSIGSIFVFLFVNIHTLWNMLGGHYVFLRKMEMNEIETVHFPSPIILKGELSEKMWISHQQVFDRVIYTTLHSYSPQHHSNNVELERICYDPEQMKEVVMLLTKQSDDCRKFPYVLLLYAFALFYFQFKKAIFLFTKTE